MRYKEERHIFENFLCIIYTTVFPFILGLFNYALSYLQVWYNLEDYSTPPPINIIGTVFIFLGVYSIFYGFLFFDKKEFLIIYPPAATVIHTAVAKGIADFLIFETTIDLIEILFMAVYFLALFVWIPIFCEILGYKISMYYMYGRTDPYYSKKYKYYFIQNPILKKTSEYQRCIILNQESIQNIKEY